MQVGRATARIQSSGKVADILIGKENKSVMLAAAIGLVVACYLVGPVTSLAPPPVGLRGAQFQAGTQTTLLLTGVAASAGTLLGLILALMRVSANAILNLSGRAYIWIFRGTPLVVQILAVYFVLPVLAPQIRVTAFWSAAIALALNAAAYNAEIIRSGIEAVPISQHEAAHALGLDGSKRFMLIIAPQALRVCLPSLVNSWVALLKDSSLAYVIGVVELSMVSTRIQAASFQPVPVFVTTAAIYLVLTTLVTVFTGAMERATKIA